MTAPGPIVDDPCLVSPRAISHLARTAAHVQTWRFSSHESERSAWHGEWLLLLEVFDALWPRIADQFSAPATALGDTYAPGIYDQRIPDPQRVERWHCLHHSIAKLLHQLITERTAE